jgi:biotin carboxylase
VTSLKALQVADVILVDAGFSARPLKHAMEAAGYRVHTVGARTSDALASENPRHHVLDYSNVDDLGKLVEQIKPTAVLPGCTDVSYEVCCQLAESGLIDGFESMETLHQLHDKAAFRSLCQRHNILVPQTFESIDEALSASCPMIIKPTDAFSGKGITVLEAPTHATILAAQRAAIAVSRSKSFVMEERVAGQLFSFSAFLTGGSVERAVNVIEFGFVNPLVVDTSFVVDSKPVESTLTRSIEMLCGALGLEDGLFHVQYILTADGPCLIEVTRRCPGDLYSELIYRTSGFDYAARYTNSFLQASRPAVSKTLDHAVHKHAIRHTITGRKMGYLASLAFKNAEALKAWYPLAATGSAMAPSPAGRVGVAFYEVGSAHARDELVKLISNDRLVSIHYSG